VEDNSIQASYDITKKSKIIKFYEEKKFFIIFGSAIALISILLMSYLSESKKKTNILLSDNYIKAKIYIDQGKKNEATIILKKLIFEDGGIYSTLSFYLILNENLIEDPTEISNLFNHILNNNEIKKEDRNLLLFKKSLFDSNSTEEQKLIESLKLLINSESLWRPQALLLLGDYFFSKKEYSKSKDFYSQILQIKNLPNNLYNHSQSQLIIIENE